MSKPRPAEIQQPLHKPRMILRKSNERGHQDHGWLNAYHTFSFAEYYDPEWMGFKTLRVINEDRVLPNEGFPTHSHRDMEIITYVIEGAIAHRDSMGNSSVIRQGELQRMSAGTGVTHSEFNASDRDVLHLLQIWIIPERAGIQPSYEQKQFSESERTGNLRLVASQDGRAGSLIIHQNANLYSAILEPGQTIEDQLSTDRNAWIQVVRGALSLNGQLLGAGDGAGLVGGGTLELSTPVEGDRAEILLFDLG